MKRNIENLIGTSKEVGLEANAKNGKYMLLFCDQNAGENHDI
jgi:hypothetical protein